MDRDRDVSSGGIRRDEPNTAARTNADHERLPPRSVVVIAGPIASGKSSLARALAAALERNGVSCAVIDLDVMYEMLDHRAAVKDDLAVWRRARRMAGALTTALLDDGVRVVIAEGEFLEEDARREFASMLPERTPVRHVTLTVSLSTAFARVDRDPARGVSRDRAFLADHYAHIAEPLGRRPSDDLVLDTEELTLDEAARAVLDSFDADAR